MTMQDNTSESIYARAISSFRCHQRSGSSQITAVINTCLPGAAASVFRQMCAWFTKDTDRRSTSEDDADVARRIGSFADWLVIGSNNCTMIQEIGSRTSMWHPCEGGKYASWER